MESQLDSLQKANSITFGGNSFSEEACAHLANEIIAKHTNKNLSKIDFSDMFTRRDKSKLPPGLKMLCEALSKKPIRELNLSDNAFGPNGAPSVVPLL